MCPLFPGSPGGNYSVRALLVPWTWNRPFTGAVRSRTHGRALCPGSAESVLEEPDQSVAGSIAGLRVEIIGDNGLQITSGLPQQLEAHKYTNDAEPAAAVECHQRLGVLLKFYGRAA